MMLIPNKYVRIGSIRQSQSMLERSSFTISAILS